MVGVAVFLLLTAHALFANETTTSGNGSAALQILSVDPIQNAINIQPNANLSVIFDTEMDSTTINDSTFLALGSFSGVHTGAITYVSATRTATLDPTSDFLTGEVVTVILTNAITDSAGNPIEGFVWNFTIVAQNGGGILSTPRFFAANTNPLAICTGFLNNDPFIDLITTNYTSWDISVLFGNGDGTFASPIHYAVGEHPQAVSCADLNNDGYLDCVVTASEDKAVLAFLNDGTGLFTPSGPFQTGTYPNDIFLSDFDGDGNIDIAAPNKAANNFSVLMGNGDGTFQPQSLYGTSPSPYGIYGGDFDEDGDIDVCISNFNPNKLNIFLNQGDGTFVLLQQPSTGIKPMAIFAASLNAGDNFLDIITPNRDSNDMSVLTGLGDGSFSAASFYSTSLAPMDVTMFDVDADGDLDAAVSNAGTDSVSVLINDGNALFDSLLSFAGGDSLAGICAGDFNNDGAIDVAAACFNADSIAVFLNFCDTIAPGPPQNLTADSTNPSPWSNDPLFVIDWTNPPDTSGIKRGLYKLGAAPTSNYDTTGSLNGQPPDSALATNEGGQMLYLWLEDFSLNVDYQHHATVELRYDSTPPYGSDASSPRYSNTVDFTVSWTAGIDSGGSGISGYDVKVKDGANPWTDWLTNYAGLSNTYSGENGHTYFFEAAAHDSANNAEAFTSTPECTTTVDTVRPLIISTYPVDGDSNIAVNANISAIFSEQMDTMSIITDNFAIVGSTSDTLTFTIHASDTLVSLNPDSSFSYVETITVTAKSELRDLAGNTMLSDKVWSFTTGSSSDTTGPNTSSANATPNTPEPVAYLSITAFVSDIGAGGSDIGGAEFFIDVPGSNGTGYQMAPVDSYWTDPEEDVFRYLNTDTLGWAAGDTHLVYIHGKDVSENWGPYDSVAIAVMADDDTTGPSFSEFSPSNAADTLQFYIECTITDPSGVFDDSTGSSGQGVYLLWDSDGEIVVDAYEATMYHTGASSFRTDSLIPIQIAGADFVYQVYAFDNDFDTQHPGDRTQDSSGVQQIAIIDVRGPASDSVTATPNPTQGDTLLALSALVSDALLGNSIILGAEFFVDDTAGAGTGNAMLAADGSFDEVSESVIDTLNISSWITDSTTTRLLFVHGLDSSGNWGPFDSVVVTVSSAADTVLPYIVTTSPDSGETGVALNRNILITFSEPMNPATLDTAGFHVYGSSNPSYTYGLSYNTATYTVTLDPDSLFAPMETLTVLVSTSVLDTANNGMAQPYQFFFIAGSSIDTIGPLVIATNAYPDTTEGARHCLATATISDSTTGLSTISAAEVFLDSTGVSGTGIILFAVDGAFNEIIEDVYENLDITTLAMGEHWFYIHGCDAASNWGPFDSVSIFVTPDDDTLGPTFSSFLPDSVPDTTAFTISCVITDPSGVYDDSTGSGGQGVYLLWDNDGELTITANERRMSLAAGDTFTTDYQIPQQNRNANFVYEVYAYDNDFDFNEPEDRTQAQSGIQSIIVYDSRGPSTDYVTISPPSPPEGINEVVVYATVSDSLLGSSLISEAEAFLDSIGATGTGFSMQPLDGAFDSILEVVLDTIGVSGWMAGDTHTFFVHGRDEYGNWGAYDSAIVFVTEYVDTIPPWIASTSPDSGEINVSLNTWIYITFTEKVDPVTVTSDKILIDGDIGGTYTFWMSYNTMDSTLSINPYNDFAPYESITVYVSSGIQDLAGNTMALSYGWWFRTGAAPDTSPPIVDTLSVAPDTIITATYTVLSAALSDNREVSNAEYFIDVIGANGTGYPVQPVDSFGLPSVDVFDTVHVDTMMFGIHTLYLHGVDASGNWGNHDSVFFFIAGEDTIGPQFTITIDPSPAYIGNPLNITAIPDEPIHADSAVICSLNTGDGSAIACTLTADSASFKATVSSVGFAAGHCSLTVSGYDLWSNRGSSRAAVSLSPQGEFLPKSSVYAWPNPAKQHRVFFHFYVNQNAAITIDIFNLEGKRIASLTGTGEGGNPAHQQASNAIIWDISNIASDIYLFRLTAQGNETGEEQSVIKKFAIVK